MAVGVLVWNWMPGWPGYPANHFNITPLIIVTRTPDIKPAIRSFHFFLTEALEFLEMQPFMFEVKSNVDGAGTERSVRYSARLFSTMY